MDRIRLKGIALYAYGGVSDAEKQVGQRYLVDVDLDLDLSAPAASDALADTVSYAAVHNLVVRITRERPFNLLESVAARIADGLLAEFPVHRVRVRFAKLLPPIDGIIASAAVEIQRERT